MVVDEFFYDCFFVEGSGDFFKVFWQVELGGYFVKFVEGECKVFFGGVVDVYFVLLYVEFFKFVFVYVGYLVFVYIFVVLVYICRKVFVVDY